MLWTYHFSNIKVVLKQSTFIYIYIYIYKRGNEMTAASRI